MNKKDADKVIKDTIEYANAEIKKNKLKVYKFFVLVIGIIITLIATTYIFFIYEYPVQYEQGMVSVKIPEDTGLDISINLSNYKTTNALLVKIDDNTYDLYINVTQTIVTKLIKDNDISDNMLRVGNGIIVDFQSGKLMGYIPNGNKADSIKHIYYIDNFTKKIKVLDDNELIAYENKVLIWSRDALK